MEENDYIKKLFQKAEIKDSTETMEEEILHKINTLLVYKKQRQRYNQIGKIGFGFVVLLSIFYMLNLSFSDAVLVNSPQYIFIGIPFILLLILFQKEIKTKKINLTN